LVATVLGSILESGVKVGLAGLSGAKDGDQPAGEDAHEMAESDVMSFAFRSFTLVKGL